MKKIIVLIMLTLSFVTLGAEVKVKVSGMVCSMCAQGIQKKFSRESAVEKLHVDMDEKVVHITTKEGQDISDDAIKKLITEAGYNVATISRE